MEGWRQREEGEEGRSDVYSSPLRQLTSKFAISTNLADKTEEDFAISQGPFT